jgi:hypothetical protein
MNTKTYVGIAALAAIALLIGAFTLPATVSVADAQGNKVKVNAKQSNVCTASEFGGVVVCSNSATGTITNFS